MIDDHEHRSLFAGINDAMTEGDIQAISSLKEDERVYQEITAELSGMVIGGDISGIPENTELKPGESTSVQIEIPKNYFGTSGLSPENEECLIRMLLRMGQITAPWEQIILIIMEEEVNGDLCLMELLVIQMLIR